MALIMPVTPGRNFTASRFWLETNTQRWDSPLSRNTQRVILGGARWRAMYTLPKMNRSQIVAWQAFLLQCRGGVETFEAYDPDALAPRGIATGDPLVNGADQTGYELQTDGWSLSTNGLLLPGDYFSIGYEMHMITEQVDSDSSGNATLVFQPALRNSPADNAVINIDNPRCQMVLIDDNQASWQTNQNGIYEGMSFAAMEVF